MKENTHLFFAESVLNRLNDKSLKKILEKNKGYYLLGSVFPDVFYHNKKTFNISQILHGREREKTNELIFEFLKLAKDERDEKVFAFTLGYISHYVLDVYMHPVIYYLTGNYYDKDLAKKFKAMLHHRQLETFWDKQITKSFFLCKKLKISLLRNLKLNKIIQNRYQIKENELIKVFEQCKKNNRLFRNHSAYLLVAFLVRFGFYKDKAILGFFSFTKNTELENLNDNLNYRDLITGEYKKDNLYDLIEKSEIRFLNLLDFVYEYYNNKISFEDLEKEILGESLDTGKVNYSVDDIIYTKYNFELRN